MASRVSAAEVCNVMESVVVSVGGRVAINAAKTESSFRVDAHVVWRSMGNKGSACKRVSE